MDDKKLFKWLGFLILIPLSLAIFGGDRFRYPCQDPENWDKKECSKPTCEVTRTCPEYIFKGEQNAPTTQTIKPNAPVAEKGVECVKQ